MASGIDHIAIAAADPDAAAVELTERVGLAFTAGGHHPGLGTFNRIAFLGDSYLELIGVEDATLAANWAVGAAAVHALEHGGGFATYGLVDDAIRTSVARLQVNGSSIGPLVTGRRELPDGERVTWWTAAPPVLGPDKPPFLIKHLYAGAEWGADALAARRAYVHPIGSPVILRQLQIATAAPQGLAADCYRDVDLEFWEVASVAVCSIGPQTIRLVPAASGRTTVVIGAAVEATRTINALGVRFEVEPVDFPLPLA
ncbi:MAG: VOC family protein [Chloroflexota bacterium]